MHRFSLSHLSDGSLLSALARLVALERSSTAAQLAHIAEVDRRRLDGPAGYSSMFAYCVGELRLSEDAASKRIQVARRGLQFPELLEAIESGRLHLTGARLLAPFLTPASNLELLEACTHKTRDQVETLLAARFPRADVPTVIRAVPEAGPMATGPNEAIHPSGPGACFRGRFDTVRQWRREPGAFGIHSSPAGDRSAERRSTRERPVGFERHGVSPRESRAFTRTHSAPFG